MNRFYQITLQVNDLKAVSTPSDTDINRLLNLFREDDDIHRYFFESDERYGIHLPSPGWARILYENGLFDDLNNEPEKIGYLQKIKARYLTEIAKEKPDDVWEIIKNLKPKEQIVQSRFLEAITRFEGGLPQGSVELACQYIESNKDYLVWVWIGEPAAEIMVKAAQADIEGALKIASIFLEIRESKDFVLHEAKSILNRHDFDEFCEKYFKEIHETSPLKVLTLLVEILDRYLKSKEGYDETKDNSYGLNIRYDNLEEIGKQKGGFSDDVLRAFLENICLAAKHIATKNSKEDVGVFLNVLNKYNDTIFKRIKFYTLKNTREGEFTKDILSVLNQDNFNDYALKNEFELLIQEKAGILEQTGIFNRYLEWVEHDDPEYRQELRDRFIERKVPDIENLVEKHINGDKARRLFRLKEIPFFKKKYEEYKAKSESTDDDLKPKPVLGHFESVHVAPDENSPVSLVDLRKMSAAEIIDTIKDPNNYSEGQSKSRMPWRTPKEGLKGAFQEVVKDKCEEFLNSNTEQLFDIPLDFIKAFFNAILSGFFENKIQSFDWQAYLKLAKMAFEKLPTPKSNADIDIYQTLLSIVQTTQRCWLESPFSIKLTDDNKDNIDKIFDIFQQGLSVPEYTTETGHPDLVQQACIRITSLSFEAYIDLGIEIKSKINGIDFQNYYLPKLADICNMVINGIYPPFTICIFGKRLPQLYYLNKEWIENNFEKLATGDNHKFILETYFVWTRPYKPLFDYLAGKGCYKVNKESFSKAKNDGIALHMGQHFVIAYFNGWLGEQAALLHDFYANAPVKLRNQLNDFFKTGFPQESDEAPKLAQDTLNRIEKHWRYRLSYFKKASGSPDVINEAIELLEWIRHCPFDAQKSLELLSETLDFTNGRASREGSHTVVEFIIEAICQRAEGNELLALGCLLKFSRDPRLGAYSTTYKEGKAFNQFIQKIKELNDDYSNVKIIREKSCELLDNYGRMGIYSTKKDYFELSAK